MISIADNIILIAAHPLEKKSEDVTSTPSTPEKALELASRLKSLNRR